MSQIFLMNEQDLKTHFAPETPIRNICETLQRELADRHLVMTKFYMDGNSFAPEDILELPTQTQDVRFIQYEVVSVVSIVDEMTKEWDGILAQLMSRVARISKKKKASKEGMAQETENILETCQDLLESYDSLKMYFGDSVLAPFIQVDEAKKRMLGMTVHLQEAVERNQFTEWQKILQVQFVDVIELWQTFFYGIRKIFF
jgi:hypothetical protein